MNREHLDSADSVAHYELIDAFDQKTDELRKSLDALEAAKTASPDQIAAARKALSELQDAMKFIRRTI